MLRLTFLQKTAAQPAGPSPENSPQFQTRAHDGVWEIIISDSKVIEVSPREPARIHGAVWRDRG